MKKLLSIVLTIAICLSLCFCFVGCTDVFSGKYVLVADDKINTALMGLDADVAFGSMNGLYINLELKNADLGMKATLKYLDTQDLLSYKIDMTGTLNMSMEAYHDGEYYYSNLKTAGSEVKTKIKDEDSMMLSSLMEAFDLVGQMDSEEFSDLFAFDTETIEGLNTKVYIDDTEGTKVKMVFSQTEGDFYIKGKAFFVFDALKVLKAMKIDMTVYEKGASSIIKMEMKEFDGKITLPKGISEWEETQLD